MIVRTALVLLASFLLTPKATWAVPFAVATMESTTCAVGSRVSLTIDVTPEEGWLVGPPSKELDLGSFRVRSVEQLPVADGHRFAIHMIPVEAGEHLIPAITLQATGPGGANEKIATEPIDVTVLSNLPVEDPQAQAQEAPEVAPMKPFRDAQRNWVPIWIAVAAFLAALIGGYFLLRKLRSRKPVEVVEEQRLVRTDHRPAWEVALEELDIVRRANYVANGDFDRQYVEVTEALRRYLENRFGVPALESTTSDLQIMLRTAPLPGEISSRILELLREADLVKFAGVTPESASAQSCEARARKVVEATIPRSEVRERVA